MKSVLIVADGMADVPLKELNGKTPLEAAKTPSLDFVAKSSICGMIDIISPGIPPGSDVAHLALLGYDIFEVYSGRGALEAIGSGVDILPNDLAFRCNFCTIDEDWIVLDRRAGRINEEDANLLSESIQEALRLDPPEVGDIFFTKTIEHRGILRLSGPNLSSLISDTDPHKTNVKLLEARPLDDSQEAINTAKLLNWLTRKFHNILKDHPINKKRKKKDLLPANAILCRGVGVLPEIVPLTLLYGIQPAAIASVPLVKGVCKIAGMRLINVPGATGTYNTDTLAKAKAAIQALKNYNFILIHVKATDLASHDRKPQQKVKMIEKVDSMVSYILKRVNTDETILAVTADHTTSSVFGEHTGEPAPVAIMGPNVRKDDISTFGERSCAKGGLGRINGRNLMPILINLSGKGEKAGS